MMKQDQVRFSQRALSALLSVLLATQPLLPAVAASITPAGNTQMDKAANGVPVVNIATPNQSGISHNKYNDYNVGKEGLILNNATGQLNQTQLGGLIQNNPNLKAGQEAKGIINEVTGANRSNLQGYTEVAGKAANVIVANPYGITCNGCGFINTPNVTLTTGKPVLDASGKLQSLDVTQGAVTIEGAGLNGSQSDAVSIISRATEINAQLHAKDLRVVAGANRVAADGSVNALKGEGTAPKVAVDTGALGGMYANRIRLVSSETGVGVNLGNLNARQGDIALDVSGKLSVNNSLASGALTAKGQSVTLAGGHKANGNITVSGQGALALNGAQVSAGQNLQLSTTGLLTQSGGSLTSSGDTLLTAKNLTQSADAQAGAGQNLTVSTAGSAALKGKNVAGQDATVKAQKLETGAQLTATRNVSLEASQGATLNGSVAAGQQLTVKGGALTQNGNLSGADIVLSGQTLMQNGGRTNASGSISLTTTGNTTLNGSTVAGTSLAVDARSLNNGGVLAAGMDATVNTDTFGNTGTVQGNSLKVTASDLTSTGSLKSNTTLDISARNAILKGDTGAKGRAIVTASGKLDNSGALISDDALTLSAAQLNNNGTISGAKGLAATTSTLTTTAGSVIHSGGNLTLNAQDATLAGETSAGGVVTFTGNSLKTTTTAQTQGNSVSVDVLSAQLDGTQAAQGGLTLKVRDSLSHGGKTSARTLTTDSGSFSNSGKLAATSLLLRGKNVTNAGTLQATGDLTLDISQALQNLALAVITAPSVVLRAADISSQGTLAAQTLAVNSQRLDNRGVMQGNTRLTVNSGDLMNRETGAVTAGELAINAQTIASEGTLAARQMTLGAQTLNNGGTLQATDTLRLTVSHLLTNLKGAGISAPSLALDAPEFQNAGTVDATTLTTTHQRLTSSGSLRATGSLTLEAATLENQGGGEIAAPVLTIRSDRLNSAGTLQGDTLSVNASQQLTNSGVIAASRLGVSSPDIVNSGLIRGGQTLALVATLLDNQLNGMIYTQFALSLAVQDLKNAGIITSDAALSLSGTQLTNSGELSGSVLALNYGTLNNATGGLLLAQNENRITAQSLSNAGTVAGDRLTLNADQVNSSGLLQGTSSLSLTAGLLNLLAGSRTLTGGTLSLSGTTFATAGQVQGQAVSLTSQNWQHSGSLLATGNLTATVAGQLTSTGELMSQGDTALKATGTDNQGNLLAAGDLSLSGNTLTNSGTVQAAILTAHQDSISNSGTLTGIAALRLASRLDMAAPLLTLTNNSGGALLTTGDLTVTAGSISNAGQWQGKQVLINADTLTSSGAIQAADALTATLAGNLNSTAGSKITANGTMALSALSLGNSGQWIAQNLTLKADTLSNRGESTGVDALSVTLNQRLDNQAGGKLLSAGALTLNAGSAVNAGQVQGGTTAFTTGQLDNSGRLQGDALALNVSGGLNNAAGGVLLSQNGLNVSSATLNNQGTLQGGGESAVKVTSRLQNDGSILSGGKLTLSTPELANGSGGLVQAVTLLLDVVNATNSGRVLATGSAALNGTTLDNRGTLQGADLLVNYKTLTNSGTVLGTKALTVKGDAVSNAAAGRLFSAGNLSLDSGSLSGDGQVVALGNATLKLVNALTNTGTLAAGQTLSVASQNAITNNGVMQGNALTLSAGGAFTNNGQLTTGNGSSTFSAQTLLLNAAGSLSAGGDVTLTSRSDITVNGFTGTAGSLTMTAAGTLLNTALLYAANNMQLFADKIHNIYGDILAGNSLWMQKNATGATNTEIINTSGNIETTNGDITLRTGHLLNQWESITPGETFTEDLQTSFPQYAWDMPGTVNLPADFFSPEEIQYVNISRPLDFGMNDPVEPYSYIVPVFPAAEKEVAVTRVTYTTVATGKAGRIVAGRDLNGTTTTLDNFASFVLAGRNVSLSGNTLNNQSWQSGTQTVYRIFTPDTSYQNPDYENPQNVADYGITVTSSPLFSIPDGFGEIVYHTTEQYRTELASSLRAVLQGNGTVALNFNNIVNDSDSTDVRGTISPVLTAPVLRTLKPQDISGKQEAEAPVSDEKISISSPEWLKSITDGLQTIAGGTSLTGQQASDTYNAPGVSYGNGGGNGDISLYPLPSGNNGYFVPSADPDSPYLITVNPKLDGLGKLDQSLYGDLYALLDMKPGQAPRETSAAYTDQSQFLGSAYFLDRLGLTPDRDYRFLGDAAFDTRYVSNAMLNLTGSRYINGVGSDLAQMQYLMDSAAAQQKALGLQFGVALSAEQVSHLTGSILWWESTVINGQTVMVPKLYLSPKDVTINNGGVISGNNVQLAAGSVTNSGSTITAQNALAFDSSNSISNLNAGLISAGGSLNLSAIGDINNIGSTIAGKTVALESIRGSINNTTLFSVDTETRPGGVSWNTTTQGEAGTIKAQDELRLSAGNDITVTGAKVSAGSNLIMHAGDDIIIAENRVADSYNSSWLTGVTQTTGSVGSRVTAGENLVMQAGHDVNVTASSVSAGESALLQAGNDLNLNAAQKSHNSRNGKSESHSSGATVSTVTAGNNLTLAAGRDITSQAAGLAAENNVVIQAGQDVNLRAEATTEGNSNISKNKKEINESVRQQGTEIASGGNTTIVAGRDVTAQVSSVTAQGDIGVTAGRDVTLTTATESDYHYKEEKKNSGGFLSRKTTHTIEEDSATREAGSLLSGDNVTVSAGNNLQVKGSAVAGDGDVALSAGNNVDIVAATNTDTSWRFKETKKSGLMGTGGIGFTIGSSKSTHELREQGTTQSESFSTVGSTGGNVSIAAGKQAHIGGADIIAQKDISLTGDSVVIDPGHDKRTRDEKFEQKSSGLTVALSGAAGSAVNSAVQTARDAKGESDDRLAALKATKAALSGVQAAQGAEMAQINGDPNSGIGVSVSLSSQKSKSEQHMQSDTVAGSTLNAGNNLSITATGKGKGENSGNILIGGSQLKAGGDTALVAANDIVLGGAASTQQTTGKNSSSGGGAGVSIGGGKSGYGIGVFANVNASKGSEKGDGTAWTETTLDSGGTVSMTSGRDAILNGAQVSGDKIVADIGRDLWMSSQQDSNDYKSTQNSTAAGGSFSFGSMTGSGYISASQDKMKSTYDSVQEQTGLFAGDGGFDVTVGRHTQLDGAVIASTATADKNSLDTGTLGFRDIHNEADYKVSHSGVSLSGGGDFGGDAFKGNLPGGVVSAAGSSGHAEGTTQAAVGEGNITIRDTANQQQDVASLSRDTEHANDSISPIFDKEKEQKRLAQVSAISDIGGQVADIARTQGELNALKEARKTHPDLTVEQLKETQTYRDEQAKFGTGSTIQRGIQAATAALQGLAGGDIASALAGASAPELAHLLKSTEGNPAVNTIAHAILGGAVAALQGNSAAAGAAGAATGELAAKAIAGMLYPDVKDLSTLSEEQKQTVSALATISAGMAGGLAGDRTGSAVAGGQAGKNAVENNSLGDKDKLPVDIFDINPLKPNVLGADGDPLKGGGGAAKGGKVSPTTKDNLISSANKPINGQGMSAAARAWEKHAGREGGTFEPLKGNVAQKNESASKFVSDVLSNPGTVKTELSRGGVEYRLPSGQGIRYNADGSFSGFLDPKR
ncbi:hemagglutinin repeat-containing protein [Enterobacter cloacae]|uniref:hemagglutinin repeat-containing protein n=2 Tax=Enterobacter cloacae complex TaxID=354276 RepID=UPI0020764967|nr:hemagglutinin repeat-containing protein [Enterobacter cloacae]MCM7408065.1 hemagglutinin repeat-containing protein [Enterobacter cloacae]